MNKMLKISAGVFLAIFTAFYLGLWIYSERWFSQEMIRAYERAESQGIEYLGPAPRLTNFPFVPEVHYTNGIKTGHAEILFPDMVVRGYPLPFTTLKLSFPQGISLGGIVDPDIWHLDSLEADFIVPYHLPNDFNEASIRAWQSRGGKIDVRHYETVKSSLHAQGSGFLSLDESLQPVFRFDSKIGGHEEFIEEQLRLGLIEPFPAALARGVLGSLARPDAETGESLVNVAVSVENRMLRVGPVLVLELPEIVWGTHSPPDLHL